MTTFERVTTLLPGRRHPGSIGAGSAQTRRVIPGPFMMGWVVDVPRGSAAGSDERGSRR